MSVSIRPVDPWDEDEMDVLQALYVEAQRAEVPDARVYSRADSVALLAAACALVRNAGYSVVNVDVTVIAERPKLAPHADAMRANLAGALGCAASQVSVKAKTNEGVESMGVGASMAAHAVALIARGA